ncbi:inositol monophosphatase family protein [Kineococcus radiotolerans]|uniref:inositol-phosphate phosphatase n=1 Tax=Kineococcus radiotolerans (strain ATCC BAA-149 / DSM 14245 / SRS30216) TaxID=266940 RepID=A6W8A0_KINRD|nr:inositol monophosphatase family protein [Kineococcus radiotolerans]ABS03039.1 Inositol-phosphate phosphatase [Kineococcus radiotolerans SRS30216 = ATCC BAA-149]
MNEELREVAVAVALAAGELVSAGRPDRVEVASTKSSPTDVVTAMDTASEQLLRTELARVRPEDGFLGEEGGHRPGRSGLTWVVDPIDGTVNYLYGLRAYAVSVAVVRAADPAARPDPATWTVLAGAVVDPSQGETWSAALGGGARLTDARGTRALTAPTGPELGQALVATGFGYDARRRAEQAAVVARLLPRVRDLRRVGAASLDLCSVAAGRVDAYYERGLKPWDLAAGALVAAEAGAVVTDFTGAAAGGHGLVAASRDLHPHLLRALADAGAGDPGVGDPGVDDPGTDDGA